MSFLAFLEEAHQSHLEETAGRFGLLCGRLLDGLLGHLGPGCTGRSRYLLPCGPGVCSLGGLLHRRLLDGCLARCRRLLRRCPCGRRLCCCGGRRGDGSRRSSAAGEHCRKKSFLTNLNQKKILS